MGASRGGAWICAWLLAPVAALAAMAASAQNLRIQFAEKVSIEAAASHTEFDAYGRRFSLDLRDNDRLTSALNRNGKLAVGRGRLLRGELRDVPGSWVRLARIGDSLEGAIWDGRDLYVVTSRERVAAHLTLPLDGPPSQTVVYRLSDTVGGLPAQFCGLDTGGLPSSKLDARTGLDAYESMVADLRADAATMPASATASEQVDVSLIADSSFQAFMGSVTRDAMLARLNTVDGIFSVQVGIMIVPTELRLIPAGSDPFTSTNAETLLEQLSNYRNGNAAVKAAGLAHLMTNKDLNGNTIGIAYVDTLCDAKQGVSLSDSELGEFFSALVMAHELGHNFGAPHDGVSGACAATAQNFLMAPELNGSSQFSQCSLSRMQGPISRARGVCITTPHYADLAIEFPALPPTIDTQQEFGFPVTVRSVGNETAHNGVLRVQLPPQIVFQGAVLAGGSCAFAGSTVTCTLGDFAASEARTVELRLTSSSLGTYFISGATTADNDYVSSNNNASTLIGLVSAVDLGVTIGANVAQAFTTDIIDFTIDVTSTRSQAAHGGGLSVTLGGAAVVTIDAGAHSCAVQPGQTNALRCDLADIASGATTRIVVHGRALNPGPYFAAATVGVPNDGDYANNSSRVGYTVRAEREVVTTVSTENLRAVIGSPYDVVYTLRSVGRLAVTDAKLTVSNPLSAIESVVPSAGTCTTPGAGMSYTCDFGTLNPNDVRTVTVRLRFAGAATAALVGATEYTAATVHANTSKLTWIYVNLRIDAQATFNGSPATLEGRNGTGGFELQSIGIDYAQNVVAVLDVPAPIRLTELRTVYNPHGFQCVIVNPQRARCSGSFGVVGQEGALARVMYDFTSDTATSGTARLTLTADSDGNAANDSATTTIAVNPYIDLGIAAPAGLGVVVMSVGEVTPVNLTLSTGRNPATGAYVSASGLATWYRVESITVNGADCARSGMDQTEFGQYLCSIGTVPANSSWPVTVRYRAVQGGVGQGGVPVYASALSDANGSNDVVYFNARTRQVTDLRVGVAEASATAARGSRLRYPLVTVTNTGPAADDVVVTIPLPSFATVDTVSSSGNCAGTTSLQCSFDALAPGASATIDLQLMTSGEGSFTSNLSLSAGNDTTPANNSAAVTLTVTAAPVSGGGSSSSSSGRKGGGGRLEWLALGLLGALVLRRGWSRVGDRKMGTFLVS
ncbi:MAG TPA: M12 family metallo-peptidase [Steroidobacteraceae bacterium]|nr:M12 family metallo-peptidase [Steroidobacteraceae bacterium]